MKVVLDPNVIISALLSSGTTAAVLDEWIDNGSYEPVVCPVLLTELEAVLSRPKFEFIEHETTALLLARLRSEGISADDPTVVAGVTADPDDDYLVAPALASRASILVSGDPDLLTARVDRIEILSPREFLDRLRHTHRNADLAGG